MNIKHAMNIQFWKQVLQIFVLKFLEKIRELRICHRKTRLHAIDSGYWNKRARNLANFVLRIRQKFEFLCQSILETWYYYPSTFVKKRSLERVVHNRPRLIKYAHAGRTINKCNDFACDNFFFSWILINKN